MGRKIINFEIPENMVLTYQQKGKIKLHLTNLGSEKSLVITDLKNHPLNPNDRIIKLETNGKEK